MLDERGAEEELNLEIPGSRLIEAEYVHGMDRYPFIRVA
jgi:hypothetical protein